jgi:hypothetical protein
MSRELRLILLYILGIVVFIYWMSVPLEDFLDEGNPDSVTIEYQCSQLDEYESVPAEVKNECINRMPKIYNKPIPLGNSV